MGLQRECPRILGLDELSGRDGRMGSETARGREFVSALSDAASAAMNVLAVDGGRGACEITRSGRGTTCRGPSSE